MGRIEPKDLLPVAGRGKWLKGIVAPKLTVTVPGMDQTMSTSTKIELMNKLRHRYQGTGREHRSKLRTTTPSASSWAICSFCRKRSLHPVEPELRSCGGSAGLPFLKPIVSGLPTYAHAAGDLGRADVLFIEIKSLKTAFFHSGVICSLHLESNMSSSTC